MKSTTSIFIPEKGGTEEFFLTAETSGFISADESVRELENLLAEHAEKRGNPVWLRIHASDIANQYGMLQKAFSGKCGMLSVIGQPQADGAKFAAEAYFLPKDIHVETGCNRTEVQLRNYRELFFQCPDPGTGTSAFQTFAEFDNAEKILAEYGGNIPENLQRTWIYCRDIDNNYAGLVSARRERFFRYGLTKKTHYIASTGIEGQPEPFSRLVRMDSLALFGHKKEQIQYMCAPEYLSPTHIYGVTFERGTRILFGDRSHYYISGTASIDKEGKIVHENAPEKQAERLVENVEALLRNHGGTLSDLRLGVVYLRDFSDRKVVENVLREKLPDFPRITLKAPVCRPGWLIEMDAIAVNANGDPAYGDFR